MQPVFVRALSHFRVVCVLVLSSGHSNMIQLPLAVTQLMNIPTANIKTVASGIRPGTPLSLVQVIVAVASH